MPIKINTNSEKHNAVKNSDSAATNKWIKIFYFLFLQKNNVSKKLFAFGLQTSNLKHLCVLLQNIKKNRLLPAESN